MTNKYVLVMGSANDAERQPFKFYISASPTMRNTHSAATVKTPSLIDIAELRV
jgi:hypothetical protein